MSDDKDMPRIAVDSRHDILHIQSNLTSYMTDAIRENALVKQQEGKSVHPKLVSRVEAILTKWVEEGWKEAGANITVNGVAYSTAMSKDFDVEPFDKALAEQVQKLEAEYEHQALALAEKRRHVPKQLRQVMKGTVEAKTSAVLGNVARYPNTATDDVELPNVDVGDVETRNKEWDDTLQALANMQKQLPSVVSRLERTEAVGKDVISMSKQAATMSHLASVRTEEEEEESERVGRQATLAKEMKDARRQRVAPYSKRH